jgi:hypothetical protein
MANGRLPIDACIGDRQARTVLCEAGLEHVLPGFSIANVTLVCGASPDGKKVDATRLAVTSAQAVGIA